MRILNKFQLVLVLSLFYSCSGFIQENIQVNDKDGETIGVQPKTYAIKENTTMDNTLESIKAQETFKRLCEWLCEQQKEGKFSGISFQDEKAARGLLAGYEIFGDKKYLEAAMAWGEAMINEQRQDGCYRMGYGIKESDQEECYVADGGETCTGMIALYSYAEGEVRKRLRESVDNYMKFRGSFRNKNNGIGIGWTFIDYLAKPFVKKDKIFREMRHMPFTIGCTLASAAAYTAITQDPRDIEWAIKDARRLMNEVETMVGGAFVESLCWTHYYLKDEPLRAEIEIYMKEKWLPNVTNSKSDWWLEHGGRMVLGLDSLTYYYESVEKDPKVLATIIQATAALCGPNLPASLAAMMTQSSLTDDQWRYLCFAAVSIGDVIQPNVSLRNF